MAKQSFVESFNSAIEGFIYVFKSQRNMRLHFLIGFIVLLLALFMNFTYIEFIIVCFIIWFVLFAEMLNTALEHTIDLVKGEFHPLARIVKDVCAGAVLLSSALAIIVGYMLFVSRAGITIQDNIIKIRESEWHVTFIVLLVLFIFVVLSKIFLHSGTPLRGGMPSGHSAAAFSIWMIVSLLYPNSLVITLVFVLAFLVARSRIRAEVHSALEVWTGALLGSVLTVFIFQLLKR